MWHTYLFAVHEMEVDVLADDRGPIAKAVDLFELGLGIRQQDDGRYGARPAFGHALEHR